MPDVAFDGADVERPRPFERFAENRADGSRLQGIAGGCAGAVGLHIHQLGFIQTEALVNLFHQLDLGFLIGQGNARGPAVGIDACSGNEGQHAVLIA